MDTKISISAYFMTTDHLVRNGIVEREPIFVLENWIYENIEHDFDAGYTKGTLYDGRNTITWQVV